jgi:hypothetical protein
MDERPPPRKILKPKVEQTPPTVRERALWAEMLADCEEIAKHG